jgi:competence protein ComEA
MLKNILLAVATLLASIGFAFAQVDVNKADQAALDGIKGVGPKTSKAILDERKKGGTFKDWADFEKRVKGIGEKNSTKLSEAGMTVNGQAKQKTSASAAKDAKKDTRANTGDAKKGGTAGVKDSKADAKAASNEVKGDATSAKKDAKKDEARK